MDRKVAFKALVGSHNYNLAVRADNINGVPFHASDRDYKVFVLPTFDDLYKGKMYSNQEVGVEEDLDFHDIRKMPDLFYKSNINFLEVLFSDEIVIGEHKSRIQETIINRIMDKKNDIVKMNLPYLFNACVGMYMNKVKHMRKGTDGTEHLMKAFGYDTKQALHAYRVLNFLVRFEESNFKDFKGAMTYGSEEREFMLGIKHGYLKADSFESFITDYREENFNKLRDKYHSHKPDEELKKYIDDIIMELVRYSI